MGGNDRIEGWSDGFLQQQLQELIGGRRDFRSDGGRTGHADAEEVKGTPRFCTSDAYSACSGAVGANGSYGTSGGKSIADEWGKNTHVFYPASQTCLSSSPEGTPQAPSLGEHHGRAQTGGSGKSRRRSRSQIHGDSSKSRVASRKAYGTIPPRRIWSSKQRHDTCNEKTYSIGGEDARELSKQQLVWRLSRSWSRVSWRLAGNPKRDTRAMEKEKMEKAKERRASTRAKEKEIKTSGKTALRRNRRRRLREDR